MFLTINSSIVWLWQSFLFSFFHVSVWQRFSWKCFHYKMFVDDLFNSSFFFMSSFFYFTIDSTIVSFSLQNEFPVLPFMIAMAIFSMFQFDKDFPHNVYNENFSFTIFDDRINSSFFCMFMFHVSVWQKDFQGNISIHNWFERGFFWQTYYFHHDELRRFLKIVFDYHTMFPFHTMIQPITFQLQSLVTDEGNLETLSVIATITK